jgi:HAD superfamily hydrolase (TIGR01509 family)
MPLGAVTFDFWNTIVFEERGHLRGRRAEAWAGILEEAGFTAEREALGAVFDSTWDVLNSRWESMEPLHPQHAAEMAVDALGQDVPFDIRTKLIEAFGDAAIGAELRLTAGIREALEALKRNGVKLGIVCDIGFTASPYLRDFLKRQEMLDLFDAWAFSDEVGVYKPSPRMFEHVLSPLGVAPRDAAHVGDRKRTDVAGAAGMGMLAVRYTGVYDDPDDLPDAQHVIDHHEKLAAALGVE